MGNTNGRQFYEEQISLLGAGRLDELVQRHYTPDAQLIRLDGATTGHAALTETLRDHAAALGAFRVISTDKFIETEDTVFFEATMESAGFGRVRVYDAFVLVNGKASHHFTGVIA
jgi:hypothetical protein